ncbi:hypothetical protein LCGC14_2312100 [marine sediment metagenome]|uniref:Uncharacterized protein n=1 Tax=marine sediment metagenome TaxID=412755 RepID=A0A0F9D7X5_9ZZZZ
MNIEERRRDIREVMAQRIHLTERVFAKMVYEVATINCGWEDLTEKQRKRYRADAVFWLEELAGKGAVLKVEREMPIPKDWIGDFNPGIFTEQVLIAAGFTATVPLLETDSPTNG